MRGTSKAVARSNQEDPMRILIALTMITAALITITCGPAYTVA